MSLSTPASYFETPRKTRDSTLSPSPAASPSAYATSQPLCIHDIGVITAQLLSEDACIRSRCLALYKDQRRCAASFAGQSRPKILSEVGRILQGAYPVSAERVGRFVMRILFCRRHNESEAYKRQLGRFYENYEPWRGDMSTVESEFLSAIRKVFQFPPAPFVNDTTAPLGSDISPTPTTSQTLDTESPDRKSDFHRFEAAKEGPLLPPVITSQSHVDEDPTCPDFQKNSKSVPEHDTSQSNANARSHESHDVSAIVYAVDEPAVRQDRSAVPVYSSAIPCQLSNKSLSKLRSEQASRQNDQAGFDDLPKASASSADAKGRDLTLSASVDETLSSQALWPESSLVREESTPDWEDGDADPSFIEGRPVSDGELDQMPRACKQGNTNEKLRDLITEPIVKEGFVYVLRAPQYSAKHFPDEIPLVKIGKAMKPGTRITQIRKTCGIDDLERVLDTQNSRCRYYYKIEKLVHAELSSYQRTLKCDCKNNAHHREWFAVPESVALQAVQRWRRFMKQDPYDDRGILRDVWSEMTDWENFQQESGDEHESRHRYWTAWLDEGISRVAATKAVAFNGGT